MPPPEISVVVPTYNRRALLARTLATLSVQCLPSYRFEVVVSDDGSSDGTREVVDAFRGRLRIRYHYQPDRGNRASAARTAGARLAGAPILVFLDAGMQAGPDLVGGHLAAQAVPGPGRAVIGYTYGYRQLDTCPGLAEALAAGASPDQVVQRFAGVPSFRDSRHATFARLGFDLGGLAVPWLYCWSTNLSVPAADFWAVGGFDEDFRGWGGEDIALGYRLFRRGCPITVARRAWGVEWPHQRDIPANMRDNGRNVDLFLAKYPEPVAELYWAARRARVRASVEAEYQNLVSWTARSRARAVLRELSRAAVPPDSRIAVVGCGPVVPPDWPPATLIDFDRELLAQAGAGGRHTCVHGIGIRTHFPDGEFDHVIVTSRLAGLLPRWREPIHAEATRIGGQVHLPAAGDALPAAGDALPAAGDRNAAGARRR